MSDEFATASEEPTSHENQLNIKSEGKGKGFLESLIMKLSHLNLPLQEIAYPLLYRNNLGRLCDKESDGAILHVV